MSKSKRKQTNMEVCIKRIERCINIAKDVRKVYKKDKYKVGSMNRILDEMREVRKCIIDLKETDDKTMQEGVELVVGLRENDLKPYMEG